MRRVIVSAFYPLEVEGLGLGEAFASFNTERKSKKAIMKEAVAYLTPTFGFKPHPRIDIILNRYSREKKRPGSPFFTPWFKSVIKAENNEVRIFWENTKDKLVNCKIFYKRDLL